jgi:hypothetical protein
LSPRRRHGPDQHVIIAARLARVGVPPYRCVSGANPLAPACRVQPCQSLEDTIDGYLFSGILWKYCRTMELNDVLKHRSYWIYSIACFFVWGILLAVVAARAKSGMLHNVLLVFAGWCICWVSATIARFVYPPPRRWLQQGELPVP